ncbi:MAG: ATP-binding protein, partial [Elainella sp.]
MAPGSNLPASDTADPEAERSPKWLVALLGLLALLLAHQMALLYRIQPAVSLWFPPAGVATLLTLWWGPVGAGLTAIASVIMAPLWGSGGWLRWVGVIDAVEPLVAWFLYRYCWRGSLGLAATRDVVGFILSGPVAASACLAGIGSLTLIHLGVIPQASLGQTISHWWLGNAIGIMAIVPTLLLATRWSKTPGKLAAPVLARGRFQGQAEGREGNFQDKAQDKSQDKAQNRTQGPARKLAAVWQRSWLEISLILGLMLGLAALTVAQAHSAGLGFQQLSFLSFLPILWAATRFGALGGMLTASASVLVTLFYYLLFYRGIQVADSFPIDSTILHVHKLSLLVQTGVALLLGTAVTEKAATQATLATEQVERQEADKRAELAAQLVQLNQSLSVVNRQLLAANQDLQSSEARFRASLETMLDCFGIYSAIRNAAGEIEDFRVEYVNDAACLTNLMTREAQIGQRLCELLPAHRNSGLFAEYCQVVETGEPLTKDVIFYPGELGGQANQPVKTFNIRVARFEDGIVATWRDVTAIKQIEAERNQILWREQAARQQAETASRMKDEFLAIVSHELRSPLNAILGWSRLLRSHKLDAEKTERALEVVERNAQAQTQLIEDLLDISRIIRGQVRLHLCPVSLGKVTQAAVEAIRPAAAAKQIELDVVVASIGLSADPDRLQQVIWNLLSNAVKFTPEGGRVSVRTDCLAAQQLAQLTVSDTGRGITAEFLPYVFERFRQEDSSTSRMQGGLGLGLSIVRHLVELHGGTVEVDSPGEGQGATFRVKLPLSAESTAAEAALPSPGAVIPLGLRVLVVDDEPDSREFLQVALENAGARVTVVESV